MENIIGGIRVPVGIAGPLNGIYVPLATNEGALVASVNRGCKAITQSGGALTKTVKIGVTRGPVFQTSGLEESFKFKKWLADHFNDIYYVSSTTSSHLKLLRIESQVVGNKVFVRFYFDSGDAMGMNMATFATDEIVKLIEQKTGIKCLSLSGNYCVDKKASWLNFIEGRGFRVWAEVIILEKVLHQTLKTTAQKFFDTWISKCMLGSAISGSMGFNAQFANIVGAIFLATGQDIAHIVEGSMGITIAEIRGKDLYVSIYLPSLMLGTVGGGIDLSHLKVKNVNEFAEVVAGVVLAGEISLISSLSEGSLAMAHKKLGRRPGGKIND